MVTACYIQHMRRKAICRLAAALLIVMIGISGVAHGVAATDMTVKIAGPAVQNSSGVWSGCDADAHEQVGQIVCLSVCRVSASAILPAGSIISPELATKFARLTTDRGAGRTAPPEPYPPKVAIGLYGAGGRFGRFHAPLGADRT